MMRIVRLSLVALAIAVCVGCTDDETAKKVLADQGYTNVVTTGYQWLGCGKGDTFATGFEATSPAGKRVKGVVCSGWMKGATIRFY